MCREKNDHFVPTHARSPKEFKLTDSNQRTGVNINDSEQKSDSTHPVSSSIYYLDTLVKSSSEGGSHWPHTPHTNSSHTVLC